MRNLNFEIYANEEPSEKTFSGFECMFFVNSGSIQTGWSILDIGGAAGNFIEFINRKVAKIHGTVMDIDENCLNYGLKKYPDIYFIKGEFPKDRPKEKYDVVTMQSLFPHLLNWKSTIQEMVNCAKQYINFKCIVREFGETIADPDVSYFYYMNSGKRVPQVILNLHQVVNFLCIEEIRAKRIFFHGAHIFQDWSTLDKCKKELEESGQKLFKGEIACSKAGHVFRGIPYYEQILGNFTVELWEESENPKRMGGLGNTKAERYPDDYKFYIPDILIEINSETYWKVYGGEESYNLGTMLNSRNFLKE